MGKSKSHPHVEMKEPKKDRSAQEAREKAEAKELQRGKEK